MKSVYLIFNFFLEHRRTKAALGPFMAKIISKSVPQGILNVDCCLLNHNCLIQEETPLTEIKFSGDLKQLM